MNSIYYHLKMNSKKQLDKSDQKDSYILTKNDIIEIFKEEIELEIREKLEKMEKMIETERKHLNEITQFVKNLINSTEFKLEKLIHKNNEKCSKEIQNQILSSIYHIKLKTNY